MPDDAHDAPSPDPHAPAPAGYAPRSDATWNPARQDYLAGDSAAQVCHRYGLPLSTFKGRARREGWRRCDQPDPPPLPDDDPEADEPVDCAALAEDALVRVRRALRHGRAAEAASWMRLHEKLTARLEAEAERARRLERVERRRGPASATTGMLPMFERLNTLTAVARNQARLARDYSDGRIPGHWFLGLSDMNEGVVEAIGLSRVSPYCSHPDFEDDGDP